MEKSTVIPCMKNRGQNNTERRLQDQQDVSNKPTPLKKKEKNIKNTQYKYLLSIFPKREQKQYFDTNGLHVISSNKSPQDDKA